MDRDGRRPRGVQSAGLPGTRPGLATATLLAIELAGLLAFLVAGQPVAWVRALALVPELAFVEPWRLLTWTLVHGGPLAALLDLVTLWLFGSAVEGKRGRARVVGLFVGGQLLGGLAAAALGTVVAPGQVLVGSSAGSVALLLGFGAAWGRAPLLLFGVARMSARTLGWIFGGLALFGPLLRADWAEVAALSSAGLWGMVYGGHFVDQVTGRLRADWARRRARRLRSRYRVIPGGRDRHGLQT